MAPSRVLQLIQDLLVAYPALSIRAGLDNGVRVEGDLSFRRMLLPHPMPIQDIFRVRLDFPNDYPGSSPQVWEIGGRIPRDPEHHVHRNGQLCLGNPLRVRLVLAANPSPSNFVEQFVIPYLCGASVKLTDDYYPQGELGHGETGLLADGMDLFGLHDFHQVQRALLALSQRKYLSDHMLCPCGCGLRLGACQFGSCIDRLRRTIGRSWARAYLGAYFSTHNP